MKNKTFALIMVLLFCCSILSCLDYQDNGVESVQKTETTIPSETNSPQKAEETISKLDMPNDENTSHSDDTLPISGGTNYCYVHKPDYHGYPWNMIIYVGVEEFNKWVESNEYTQKLESNDCPFPRLNIYEFIKYFDYPKEVFIDQFNTEPWVSGDFNIDLLYSGDIDAIDAYYRNYDDLAKLNEIKESNFISLKTSIINNHLEKLKDYTNWKIHSLIELMYAAGLDVSTVQHQAFKKNEIMDPDSIYQTKYDYNFDIITAKSSDKIAELIKTHTPFYLDCLICGQTPYDTPYEKQVAENKILFGK